MIEIICDFDGTISRPDTVDQILEQLAGSPWRAIEKSWQRGEIDSRECMARQIPLIRGGWSAIARFLDERVTLHPSFAPFAAWCASRRVPLRIASEGLDRVIDHLLAREGIVVRSVWASQLVLRADGGLALAFGHASGRTHCAAALCKCELFDRPRGRVTQVLIGDGRSDFCAASHADVVFARGALLENCRTNAIASIPFESFDEVRSVLERRITPPAFRREEEMPRRLVPADGR